MQNLNIYVELKKVIKNSPTDTTLSELKKSLKKDSAFKKLTKIQKTLATRSINILHRHMSIKNISEAVAVVEANSYEELLEKHNCGPAIAPILKFLFSKTSE